MERPVRGNKCGMYRVAKRWEGEDGVEELEVTGERKMAWEPMGEGRDGDYLFCLGNFNGDISVEFRHCS